MKNYCFLFNLFDQWNVNCILFKYLTILFGSIPQLAAIIIFGAAWLIRAQSSRAANPK